MAQARALLVKLLATSKATITELKALGKQQVADADRFGGRLSELADGIELPDGFSDAEFSQVYGRQERLRDLVSSIEELSLGDFDDIMSGIRSIITEEALPALKDADQKAVAIKKAAASV